LLPQQAIVSSGLSAQVEAAEVLTAFNGSSGTIPWPTALAPQHSTRSAVVTAQVRAPAAATET
jgi:hypothetical protein